MKTMAVIFGFLVLVYLVAWLSLLDLFAHIGALLLIAAAAVGVGALVVHCRGGPKTAGPDGGNAGRHNLPDGGVGAAQKVTFPTA